MLKHVTWLAAAVVAMGAGAAVMFGAQALAPQGEPTTATTTATTTTTSRPTPQATDKPAVKMRNNAPDPSFIKQHDSYVALAKKGDIDLYFEGDSITDFWHTRGKAVWAKEFAGWKPGNFGISGDRTQHVLWRLENGELDGVKPKVFVLMIGTNNFGRGGGTNEQIVAGNAAILKEMRETNPQAKILLLGIFPRWGDKEGKTQLDRVKEVNEGLAKLDDGKNVKYLDIGDKFLNADGVLTKEMMPDGLHPAAQGYEIWAAAIKPVLTEWLGPPAQEK